MRKLNNFPSKFSQCFPYKLPRNTFAFTFVMLHIGDDETHTHTQLLQTELFEYSIIFFPLTHSAYCLFGTHYAHHE
jgi:hypothetical protein